MSRWGGPPDMWRKITRFALAVVGEAWGVRGLVLSGEDTAAEATPPRSKLFSAIEPMPSAPDWFRKCRRVMWRARWMASGSIMGLHHRLASASSRFRRTL